MVSYCLLNATTITESSQNRKPGFWFHPQAIGGKNW